VPAPLEAAGSAATRPRSVPSSPASPARGLSRTRRSHGTARNKAESWPRQTPERQTSETW